MFFEYELYIGFVKKFDYFFFNRPAPILAAQVSIDDCRRCELANILRDKESREVVRIIDK